MVTQMTRAEYEKQFGVKPFTPITTQPIPQSQGDKGLKGIGTGIAKGLGQTATGLGTLTSGLLKNIPGKVGKFFKGGQEQGKETLQGETFKPKGTAEKIGKFGEQVAEFAIPGTKVAKATQGASFLPKIGARAVTSGAVATAQSGEVGKDTAIAAGVEAGIPIVGKIVSPATKFIGNLLKGTASGLSGAPSEAIEQIYKNPKVALQTAKEIRQSGSANVLRKNAEKVVQGVGQIKKEARAKYGEAVSTLKAEDIKPDVFRNNLQGLFDKYGFSTSGKGREIVNVEFRDAKNLKKANSIANMISGTELNGLSLNKTLKRVEDLKYPNPKTEEGLAFNAFVSDMTSGLKNAINTSTSKLDEINKQFSGDMQLAEATEQILGKVKYKNMGEVNRVAKNLEKLFTDKGLDPNTVDKFLNRIGISDDAFKSSEAMRQVASKSYSANTLGTNPLEIIRAFTSSVVSPKMVGKIAAYTGLTENIIKEMSEKLSPASRGAIINLLTKNGN